MELSIEISLAKSEDIKTLAKLHDKAFENDKHTQLKTSYKGPEYHILGMTQALVHWASKPSCTLLKATVTNTGDILGWLCYVHNSLPGTSNGDIPNPDAIREAFRKEREAASSSAGEKSKTGIDALEFATSTDLACWQRTVMQEDSKCMFICSIAVDPDFQGSGVGSALLQRCTRIADEEVITCWVCSSMDGVRLFAKAGFESIVLKIDLDGFVEKGCVKSGDGVDEERKRWGVYRWTYLMRWPQQLIA